jgi:hypothetical protein
MKNPKNKPTFENGQTQFTQAEFELLQTKNKFTNEFIEASEDGILEAICFIATIMTELEDEEKKKTAMTVIGNLSLIRDFLRKMEKKTGSGLLIGIIHNQCLDRGIEMLQ